MSDWLRLRHIADVVTSNVDKLTSESEIPVRLINLYGCVLRGSVDTGSSIDGGNGIGV